MISAVCVGVIDLLQIRSIFQAFLLTTAVVFAWYWGGSDSGQDEEGTPVKGGSFTAPGAGSGGDGGGGGVRKGCPPCQVL